MQKHKFVHDCDLSAALHRPLEFGDREQIDALNDLETKINQEITEKAKISSGKLKYFNVRIDYGGTQEIKVLAVDETDAREKAKEEADYDSADLEIDCITVSEIK